MRGGAGGGAGSGIGQENFGTLWSFLGSTGMWTLARFASSTHRFAAMDFFNGRTYLDEFSFLAEPAH